MALRILITGAGGQMGQEFVRIIGDSRLRPTPEWIALDRNSCDLAAPEAIRAAVRAASPNVILNCGAYTDVNGAESDRATAYAVNAQAPGVLAEECARLNALLIHFSTDYVFDGRRSGPYEENDLTAPLNVYGASKLAGEQAVLTSLCRHFIFRTSWIYSARGHNFVRTMLKLGREREQLRVVEDQVGAPTSTRQIAEAVIRVLGEGRERASGLYHLSAQGAVSWCDLARHIFARAGDPAGLRVREVLGVSSSQYVTAAVRPLNSRLSNEKFRTAFGFVPGRWQDALDLVLDELGVLKEEHAAR